MNSDYPDDVTDPERRQAAAEAWRTLVRFWMEHNRFLQAAGEVGLGPPHAKALLSLTADEPPPMGMLAEHLSLPTNKVALDLGEFLGLFDTNDFVSKVERI